MLGATHACANPLTARYGTTHGVAIALLLPHVVRWNGGVAGARYAELLAATGRAGRGGRRRRRARRSARGAGRRGRSAARAARRSASPKPTCPLLADEAALQWTGRYNPRPFDAAGARGALPCRVRLRRAVASCSGAGLVARRPALAPRRRPAARRRRSPSCRRASRRLAAVPRHAHALRPVRHARSRHS